MKQSKGFSLVELMAMVALLAFIILMVMSLGRGATLNSKFTSVINNFLADFNQVRNLASTENRYFAIVFDNAGRVYTIQRQSDITNFNNWQVLRTVRPLEYDTYNRCFDPVQVQSFAINSLGEVRPFPIVANALPTQVQQTFFVTYPRAGSVVKAYQSRVTIYPYGGVKVDKL